MQIPPAPGFSCWFLAMRHAYLMYLAGCCGIDKLVNLHVLDVLSLNTNQATTSPDWDYLFLLLFLGESWHSTVLLSVPFSKRSIYFHTVHGINNCIISHVGEVHFNPGGN